MPASPWSSGLRPRKAARSSIRSKGRTTALGTATLGLELCEQVAGAGGRDRSDRRRRAVRRRRVGGEAASRHSARSSASSLSAPTACTAASRRANRARSSASRRSPTVSALLTRCRSRSNSVAATSMSWCASATTNCARRCASCCATRSSQSNRPVPLRLPRCSVRRASGCAASELPRSSAAATSTRRRYAKLIAEVGLSPTYDATGARRAVGSSSKHSTRLRPHSFAAYSA